MSAPRLPLTALRVFEAAARHESFLQAAEELAITPGAVSRQIKALETELAIRLFERFNRAVRLTETGRRLAVGVRQGLSLMEEAVAEVRAERPGVLAVTAMHSFAARWLVPRLHLFNERHPDIQVLVAASDAAVDLVRERYDVAIRFGRGPYPGFSAHKLVSLFMFPVCSPRLLEQTHLTTPHDLARAHLLADVYLAQGEPHWGDWLAQAGAPEVDWRGGQQFSNVYLAIEAAIAGRGVALGERALVLDELATGRLVKPFDIELRSSFSQWILTLPEKADRPDIRKFRNWLLAQADADGLQRFE
ncbi:MAG: transcriptional regulator GcvA [Alphaproteobacteria bacterium]|nr:transcriptional regulator GcvA [Alphaproteobacteria bacterium]MBU1515010.1 transcriptional regulator GcvA [Alphaproteobacteria bacterium]MBU2095659.1 transcriptional regulator GcvA [Alphaproteobacteria bacterium]MBU2151037.1 transcriptional regulator GcvA [Alphaproteobacteria bacterium]MBU2306900.1 transcriptional regulator GcvA [Alphaproteobacteria bacterium]